MNTICFLLHSSHPITSNLSNVVGKFYAKRLNILYFLLITLFPASSFATEKWSDKGNYDVSWFNSSEKDFVISNEQELSGLAYLVNNGFTTFSGKTITLSSNISLSGKIWVPIGNEAFAFQGTLDGNNFEITGIEINRNSVADPYVFYGFFGRTKSANIKNLKVNGIIDWEIDNYYPTQCIGSLVAKAENSKMCECVSNISINYVREHTSTHKYNIYLGGFVGISIGNTFENCASKSRIYTTLGRYGYIDHGEFLVAGFCAYDKDSKCTYCGTEVDLDIRISDTYNSPMGVLIGGLFGGAYGTTINSCYSIVSNVYYMNHENSIISLNIAGLSCEHTITSNLGNTGVSNCYAIVKKVTAGTGNINTPVRFGGMLKSYTDYKSECYISNYSNNDVEFDCAKLSIKRGYDGLTTFSSSEMLTEEFVDELNLFFTLNGKEALWHIGKNGYPVIWDVFETNTSDVTNYVIDKGNKKKGKYIIDGELIIINDDGVKYNIKGTKIE